jgi:GNAT superfamily N-acetyltransferase
MLGIQVRRATVDDLDTLVRFNAAMAQETEGKALDLARLRSGVMALFQDPGRGFYLVAEVPTALLSKREIPPSPFYEREARGDWQVVGQLLITTEWSDWRNAYFWWIQSVYVAPDHRRRGVYRALENYVRAEARRCGDVCGLRLYVDQHNHVAQQVYARLGMARSHYYLYEVEFEG